MRIACPALILLLAIVPAMAQDTPEARLRDLLRRTTTELRAAQDSQALLQASLDQEKQKTVLLQKQLDDLTAHPVAPAKPSTAEDDIARLRAESLARAAALESGMKQWQE